MIRLCFIWLVDLSAVALCLYLKFKKERLVAIIQKASEVFVRSVVLPLEHVLSCFHCLCLKYTAANTSLGKFPPAFGSQHNHHFPRKQLLLFLFGIGSIIAWSAHMELFIYHLLYSTINFYLSLLYSTVIACLLVFFSYWIGSSLMDGI